MQNCDKPNCTAVFCCGGAAAVVNATASGVNYICVAGVRVSTV